MSLTENSESLLKLRQAKNLSITRTVWPKLRKAMPPGTHSMPLSAQVIRSVQEQQGHIAERSMVRSERDRWRCFRKHYTTLSECNHSCPFHTLNTISPWYLIHYETGLEVQDPHRPNQVQMKPSQQALVCSFFCHTSLNLQGQLFDTPFIPRV